jgi:hypothetical protein
MKEKESAGNVETKLMSEQGAGFSSVVWKKKKKKKIETAKGEDTTHQDEATTDMTGTLTAETGDTTTRTGEMTIGVAENIATR